MISRYIGSFGYPTGWAASSEQNTIQKYFYKNSLCGTELPFRLQGPAFKTRFIFAGRTEHAAATMFAQRRERTVKSCGIEREIKGSGFPDQVCYFLFGKRDRFEKRSCGHDRLNWPPKRVISHSNPYWAEMTKNVATRPDWHHFCHQNICSTMVGCPIRI